ncbi:MAG: TolC family protein [candidate division KSB1 bacterium]|nr:TolC family protein [candidate division KSB1 bacterium]
MKQAARLLLWATLSLWVLGEGSIAQERGNIIVLTLDTAVGIGMARSYRIKQLELEVRRRRAWLQAERAGLKSKVFMNIQAPNFRSLGEYKWNSTLLKDELVRQNNQTWELQLSVRQPVILFGYPTDGYLSLNYRIYKYLQLDGYRDISYYNRYFLKFEQPLFLPNRLKNAIEEAELDLQERELEYIRDRVGLLEDLADNYYHLFSHAYRVDVYRRQLAVLDTIRSVVEQRSESSGSSQLDRMQVQIEIANLREKMLQEQSSLRLGTAELKRHLRIDEADSVIIPPMVEITPFEVTLEDALQKGYTLNPELQILRLRRRQRWIELQNTRSWNSFHLNLEVTYGLEKENDTYRALAYEMDRSYSVTVNAYVPIWDWGQRNYQIEARNLAIEQVELTIEEAQHKIRSEIANAVANLREHRDRILALTEHLQTARQLRSLSLEQYVQGRITLQDLLQTARRELETELNYLETYLGYRKAFLDLTTQTYFDYEKGKSLADLFLR